MPNGSLSRDEQVLLVEYRKAQDSAEHHSRLGWSISGIMLSASMVLFALVVRRIMEPGGFDKLLLATASAPGILSALLVVFIDQKFARAAKQKYDRCKEIERRFAPIMTQHTAFQGTWPKGACIVRMLCIVIILAWFVALVAGVTTPSTGSVIPQ